jgi:hypothetical protein
VAEPLLHELERQFEPTVDLADDAPQMHRNTEANAPNDDGGMIFDTTVTGREAQS